MQGFFSRISHARRYATRQTKKTKPLPWEFIYRLLVLTRNKHSALPPIKIMFAPNTVPHEGIDLG